MSKGLVHSTERSLNLTRSKNDVLSTYTCQARVNWKQKALLTDVTGSIDIMEFLIRTSTYDFVSNFIFVLLGTGKSKYNIEESDKTTQL